MEEIPDYKKTWGLQSISSKTEKRQNSNQKGKTDFMWKVWTENDDKVQILQKLFYAILKQVRQKKEYGWQEWNGNNRRRKNKGTVVRVL